mgnify:FL=1
MGFLGGSKSQESSSTKIPEWLEKAGEQVYTDYAKPLADTPFQAYGGQMVADLPSYYNTAFQNIQNNQGAGSGAVNSALNNANNVSQYTGSYNPNQVTAGNATLNQYNQAALNQYMNPYAQYVIASGQQAIRDDANMQAQNSYGQAALMGALGTRENVRQGDIAANRMYNLGEYTGNAMAQNYANAQNQFNLNNQLGLQQQFGNIANQMAVQNQNNANAFNAAQFGLGVNQQNNANLLAQAQMQGALGQQQQSMKLQDVNALLKAGQLQGMYDQNVLDARYGEFLRGQNDPFMKLQALNQTIGSVPFSQTTTSSYKPSFWENMGTIASGVGSIMAFSDVRLKKDIQYLGKHEKGFGVYKWNWNDDAKAMGIDDRTVGVLAQELIEYMPEAVSVHPKGYLQVNYNLVEG